MSAFGNPQQQQQPQQQQGGQQPSNTNTGGSFFSGGTGTGTTSSAFGGGTGTSLFGNPPSTTTNPPTSVFGGTGGGGFFGGGAFGSGTSGGGGTNPSPFGGAGMFGQTSTTTTTTPATGTGTTGTGTTGTTSTTPANIFGSTPSSSLFGATSATPASGTTTTTIPATGSLFGGGTISTNPASGTTSNNLFAAKPSTPIPGQFGGSGSIFGNTTNPAPSTTGGTTSTLFGSGATGTSSTLFGVPKLADTKDPSKPETGGSGNATPAPPPAFGSGLFGMPKPAENKDVPKPATSGSLFGGPLSTNTTPGGLFGGPPKPAGDSSTNTTSSTAGGLFGLPPKPTDSATATSTSTMTPGFGSNLFGAKKPEASGTSSPVPPAPGGFSMGGAGGTTGGGLFGATLNKDATKPEEKKDATPTITTNLFGPPKDGDKKDGTAAGTSTAITGSTLGLFGKPAERKDTPGAGTISSIDDKSKAADTSCALTIIAQPPSMLRGKTIEEIVNKWSSDLEAQVKEFSKFAMEVAVWDRALIENGNSLAALMSEMLVAEREQADIDQALDHIEQQQKDLMATLEIYEKTAEENLNTQSGSIRALDTGPADTERDRNYMLATDLYTHLDDLSGSLTQMIEAVNALSTGPGSQQDGANNGTSGGPNGLNEDPMNQIAQILSSHLESLQWIDGSVRELESSVSEVEKRVREAGLSVNGGGSGGHGRSTRSIGYGLR